MAEYISGGLESNAADILATMFAEYQEKLPGWVPNKGDPIVIAMEIIAQRQAVLQDIYSQVKAAIYTDFGTSIANVPFKSAIPATAKATLNVGSEYLTEAHELEAGFRVALEGPEGPVTFETVEDIALAIGVEHAEVTLQAAEAGVAGNGLSGVVTQLDTRTWVQGFSLLADTASGEEAESEVDYRNRLVSRGRRRSDAIITAIDAREAALETPGVGRCLVLDNYVPGSPPEENVPGAFTYILADENGENVSSAVKDSILSLTEDDRLLDLVAHAIDPERTPIEVQYAFIPSPGYIAAEIEEAADAAVAAYMNPADWGNVKTAAGAIEWQDTPLVRYGELYAVLNSVPGLNYVTALTLNGEPDKNIDLAGPGALPELTSVSGSPRWADTTKQWSEIASSVSWASLGSGDA